MVEKPNRLVCQANTLMAMLLEITYKNKFFTKGVISAINSDFGLVNTPQESLNQLLKGIDDLHSSPTLIHVQILSNTFSLKPKEPN